MTWTLAVARTAQKQLRRIPVRDRDKIAAAIRTMAIDPFEGDIIKLEGEETVTAVASVAFAFSFGSTGQPELWASARSSAELQLPTDSREMILNAMRLNRPLAPVRPERALQRNPHQLAAGPDPRLLKQLLQRRLDRAVANAELGANLLIGETLEYASQDLLLASGHQGADPLLLRSEEHT